MDLVIEGHHYSTAGRLDAFTQLHIARKLSPSIGAVDGLVKAENADKEKSILTVLMLSYIPDADAVYVINKCLSSVIRKSSGQPSAKIMTKEGTLMFDDISMGIMLELTMAVVEENLGDFFRQGLLNLKKA